MNITSKCLKFNYSTLLKKKKVKLSTTSISIKKERSGGQEEREGANPRQLEKNQWKIEFMVRLIGLDLNMWRKD